MTSERKYIDRIKKRYDDMKNRKSSFTSMYDILARYVLGRQNFTNSQDEIQPEDLHDPLIFDDTAQNSNMLMSASHIGALWPNGGRSFKIRAPLELQTEMGESPELKRYYEFITKKLADGMDNPKSGFLTTLEEYMTEVGALGTSCIFVEEADHLDLPVVYKSMSARDLFIDVAPNGNIDTIYIRRWMTLLDISRYYGNDSLSEDERKQVKSGVKDSKKYEIVVAIEPRELTHMSTPENNKDFPYASCHVDITRDKELRESGYKELPAFVGRFWHRLNEVYGTSPGMLALPSIREINELRYDYLLAQELMLFPPMTMIEGSVLGDVVETSPKGLTILSMSGKLGNFNGKPLEPLNVVGDMQGAQQRILELTENIKNYFFLDRIMDLNNEQRMTAYETGVRNDLRGQSLNTFYTRTEKEIIEPCIERTFNIYLEKGLLGIPSNSRQAAELEAAGITPVLIPDILVQRMLEGKEVYRIEFTSPAARIKQSEELQGIQQTFTLVANLMGANPEVGDNVDFDFGIKRMAELNGSPSELIRAKDQVEQMRQARQAQEQQAMQIQAGQAQSQSLKNVASASKDMEPE